MQHLIRWLHARSADPAVLEDVAALTLGVNALAERMNLMAGSLVGFETILQYHNLLSPEVLEAIKPLMEAKAKGNAESTSAAESAIDDIAESSPSAT